MGDVRARSQNRFPFCLGLVRLCDLEKLFHFSEPELPHLPTLGSCLRGRGVVIEFIRVPQHRKHPTRQVGATSGPGLGPFPELYSNLE